MKEILRLKEAGQLNATQMLWFRLTKPVEELYDLTTDPYEFNNLAENPAYQSKLEELRNAHLAWLNKYGDKGSLPEKEMIAQMLSGGQQPEMQAPVIKINKAGVSISCATEGASILYMIVSRDAGVQKIDSRCVARWQPYTKPLKVRPGDTVHTVATRIGYKQSEEKKLTF
jgi:N-sulfoglucosamine sulfohydrolase